MNTKLNFRLELMSDYHVGSGQGKGTLIDSSLFRSSDGVPVLRGTTLVGLLRDALYELLQTEPLKHHRKCLASGKNEFSDSEEKTNVPSYCGQWDNSVDIKKLCPVCRLFGTPKHPKRWQFSSARPDGLQNILITGKSKETLGGKVVTRNSINPRSRRADEHHLFSHELGNQQFVFRFSAKCDFNDEDVLPEAALLVASARFLRNMGANRRRGWGECRLHLDSVEGFLNLQETSDYEEMLLNFFKKYWIEGEPLPASTVTVSSNPEEQIQALVSKEGEPQSLSSVRFRMIVRIDEPLICSTRAEAGNQFNSLSFIPGSTLLGAFAARVVGQYDLRDSNSTIYQRFLQLFRRDAVRFPFLYPAFMIDEYLYPAIPAPLDLLTCKIYSGFTEDREVERHGVFADTEEHLLECPKCKADVSLEPLGGFIPLRSSPKKFQVHQRSEMHPRVNLKTKRVGDEGLFGYTAISEGQYFLGELVFDDAKALKTFTILTDLPPEGVSFTLRMGRASSKGYGKATILLNQLSEEKEDLWIGQPIEERVKSATETIVMTTLTDTIIYDAWGRSNANSINNLLSDSLGEEGKVKVTPSSVKTRSISAFNTHLGLPRREEIAITAGSAFSCRFINVKLDKIHTVLKRLESEGIGERRGEGFGRIAFNHPVYDSCQSLNDADTIIEIPEKVQLESTFKVKEEHFAGIEREFRDRWNSYLKDILTEKASDQTHWEAVARLIHRYLNRSIAEIKAEIQNLGKADNLLQSVSEGREKENFFESRGKALKKQLIETLEELESHCEKESRTESEKSRLRQIGLMILTEHLAFIAQKAE